MVFHGNLSSPNPLIIRVATPESFVDNIFLQMQWKCVDPTSFLSWAEDIGLHRHSRHILNTRLTAEAQGPSQKKEGKDGATTRTRLSAAWCYVLDRTEMWLS